MSGFSKEILMEEICKLEHMINLLYLKYKTGQCQLEEYSRGRAEYLTQMAPSIDEYIRFLMDETRFEALSEPTGTFKIFFYSGHGWA